MPDLALPVVVLRDEAGAAGALVCNASLSLTGLVDLRAKLAEGIASAVMDHQGPKPGDLLPAAHDVQTGQTASAGQQLLPTQW